MALNQRPSTLNLLLALTIVAFCAVMTGWLIRANWNDGEAPFSDLPPVLVLRQVLKHEAVSELGIFRGQHRIGSVSVTPVSLPANAINFDGVISLAAEGARPETYNFSIHLDLTKDPAHLEGMSLRFRRKNPAVSAFIEVLLREQKIRYTIQNGGLDLGTQEMPITAGGFSSLLPALAGLPALPMSAEGFLKTVACRAARASFKIRGEQMDGFRVSLSAAEMNAKVTLGQLGEIFLVRTSTEYQLLADGLEPKEYLP